MHSTTTARFGRRAFGLAAVGALALAACGSEDAAEFEDAGGSGASDGGGSDASDGGGAAADATAGLPRLDAGFILEDFTKDVTVSDTLQPEKNTVITPTGTLTIDGLQALASVSAEAVELDPETGEAGEEAEFAAADGEVLRAIDLSFTHDGEDDWGAEDGLPPTDISIRAGGSQSHLAEITSDYSSRILVSVPEDGSAALVVSSEGHDQVVDLLTGERQEDDIAAAYYREDRVQEPHHTFPVSIEPIPVLYGGDADSEIDATVSFQATTLTLTAWTEGNGWAEPGGAWLEMAWKCETTIETSLPGLVKAGSFSATASLTVADETTTDEVHADKLNLSPSSNTQERTLIAAVSADTSAATVSMSGTFTVEVDAPRDTHEMDGSGDREFSLEELTVEFPLDDAAPSAQPSDGGGG
ncbi:hypothetical protein ACT3SP_08700 [Brachybacterium sp. AOP43-C2-M15]|uniref:hypothetical protein n=1 Tax=Brachybacterium sp. AOP43-C2-M15 TaxID=3457661 RepID=UPI0040347959